MWCQRCVNLKITLYEIVVDFTLSFRLMITLWFLYCYSAEQSLFSDFFFPVEFLEQMSKSCLCYAYNNRALHEKKNESVIEAWACLSHELFFFWIHGEITANVDKIDALILWSSATPIKKEQFLSKRNIRLNEFGSFVWSILWTFFFVFHVCTMYVLL